MSTQSRFNRVGKLHMQLSELESKLERARREGYVMAEHLQAIAKALAPEEGHIADPVIYANDEVFAVVGHVGEMIQTVGSKEFPVSEFPNIKGLLNRIYALTTEIERVRQSLKDAEQEAKRAMPWE